MTSESPRLINLDHLGLLRLQGADARNFLQGQVTCDLRQLSDQHLMHGAHCTPKGRMLANFDALAGDGDSIFLRLHRSAIPALLASLKKYIVFSKSTVDDITGSMRCLGVQAIDLQPLLETLNLDNATSSSVRDGVIYHCLDDQRLECWLPSDGQLPQPLAMLPLADDSHCWRARDIELGRGWIEAETSAEFVPQLLNLQSDAISGISFSKGCYTGQEIVARMHYKGKLKRHMYRFQAASELHLPANSPLFQPGSDNSVGHVINSVEINGRTEILAVVTEEAAVANNVYCDATSSQKLERTTLPYAITTA